MKKRIVGLHGTNQTAFTRIMREGFEASQAVNVWTCSDGFNYFWDPTRFESWGESEAPWQEAFDEALGSGYISIPFAQNDGCHRVVLLVDLTGLEVEDDKSCTGMDSAIRVRDAVPASRILCAWRESLDLAPFKLGILAENMDRAMYERPPLSEIEKEYLETNLCVPRERTASICEIVYGHESEVSLIYTRPRLPKWATKYLKYPSTVVNMKIAA